MGLLDRFRAKPKPKRSSLQAFVDDNMLKEARTPVYDMASAAGLGGAMKLEPLYDLHYLERLSEQYSHLQTVITRIASQSIAKGYRLEPTVDDPNEGQLAFLENLLDDPSGGHSDTSCEEIIKAVIRQLEIFDDAWVSLVYDYVKDENGAILGKSIKEFWVEDAKFMRFNTDRFGRFQEIDKFCPSPDCRVPRSGTACSECGASLESVAYTFEDAEGDIPFARDEIIHFNKYSSQARLYGQSPILGLQRKIESGLAIESYMNKLYRLERPPKGFLDIPGHTEEALNRLGEYIAEESRRNPNFVPIISSGEGQTGAKFVPVMPDVNDTGTFPFIERVNQDINAAYGIMPLAVGDTTGVGGLNAEGEQLSMMDRTIIETQQIIEEGLFRPLFEQLKITDWEYKFNDIDERNEQIYLANLRQKADIIAAFQSVGITLDLDEEGQILFPEVMESASPSPTSPEAEEPSEPADLFQP